MDSEKLRVYCLSLPGVSEGVKWDNLCYMVADKIFCLAGMTDTSAVTFKVSNEDFEILTERSQIVQAPYFARNQWVSVEKRNALKPKEWEHYLKEAYELIKAKLPKKVRESLG